MTKQQVVEYLRNQAYWIEFLAKEIEDGKFVTSAWAVDLEIPKYDKEVTV